jgi:hypothetical protein
LWHDSFAPSLVPTFAIVAAVGIGTGVVGRTPSASSATAPTYSYTIAGTDMHSLDPRMEPIFIDGGGVEAVLPVPSNDHPTYPYLEAGVDLPVGAKVKSVAVSYAFCEVAHPEDTPSFVFGSYSPATGDTVQNATLAGPLSGSPCHRATVTTTGKSVTTTAAGRRYAIDYLPQITPNYPGSGDSVFYGATVKYTCTSPCVP